MILLALLAQFVAPPAWDSPVVVPLSAYGMVYQAPAVGSAARTTADRLADRISIKDFAANGVSGAKCVADNVTDCTGAFIAAANFCGTQFGCTIYVPGSPNPYLTQGIKLTATNKQITFEGDGLFASRIRFTSANVDGYALSYAAIDNSWGGLRMIALETSATVTAVLYILNPNNLFMLDRVMINGGTQINNTPNATHGIYVDDSGLGGSFLTMFQIYATSVSGFNYYFNGQQTQASFSDIGGNHDIGPSGLINVVSTGSGPTINLIGVRAENSTGKDLIQYATATQGRISIHSSYFSNGVANSIVRTKSGTAPWWFIDARYQNNPTNIYVDDVSGSLTWPFVAGDNANPIMSPITPSYLYSGHNRMWINNTDGFLRTKNGGAPSSVTDGMVVGGGFATMTYGASVFPDATAGTVQEVVPTNGTAFVLANPLNVASALAGQRICARIKNTFGVLGAMTFGTNYRTSGAWTQPANGFSRIICFNSDAGGIWREESRQGTDVTN